MTASRSLIRLPIDSLAFSLLEAAYLVAAVQDGRTLTACLAARFADGTLSPAQRGAISDLSYTTLRHFGRGDFFLGHLLRAPLADPVVHALLLVALDRLETRPAQRHTVVDQTVEAAATIKRGAFKGLVNAVLRRFLREETALLAAAQNDDVARLTHPRWWIDAVRARVPHADAVLAAGNTHPPMALRVNRRRTTPEALLAAFQAAGIAAQRMDEDGLLLDTPCAVSALPGFADGAVSVQDLGAQHAARWLDAQAGMRVLDACAAPGGKTAHILERADASVLALEIDPLRAQRVTETLNRLGLAATLHVADAGRPKDWWNGVPFDRILADVPCSASGVARRHPDIKWLRRATDIAQFARTQAWLLDALWPLLKPGGRMLYATCSVFPEENQDQMAAFCQRHADCQRVPIEGALDQPLLPSATHDGFYYALLEKRS